MPEQITIDIALIVAVCLMVTNIATAIAWLRKGAKPLFKPIEQIRGRLDDVEDRSKTCAEFFANDKRRLDEHEAILNQLSSDNKIILESIALLMKHAETGNSTGEVSDGRDKLETYLINR